MIAHLRGTVSSISAHAIVIDVSGVGYLVYSTSDQISNCRVGQEITLQTVQIFREDSVQLFGFSDLDQVGVFNLLCTVTGVGAKTALGVISQLGVYGIQEAVAKADSDAFNSVSGIGPKTAKQIILTLTGKLVTEVDDSASHMQKTIVSALVNLGYPEKLAKQATAAIANENKEASEEQLLKLVLNSLSSVRRNATNE